MQTNSEDRLLDYIDELESEKCAMSDSNDRMKREILHLKSVVYSKNVLLICLSIIIILLFIRL